MTWRFGLVGGGSISRQHIEAATMNGRAELVCGCFSRDAVRNQEFAGSFGVARERAYEDYSSMIEREAVRSARPDFVIVATPNVVHFDVCRQLLDHGFPVVCEKPLTVGLAPALELAGLARERDLTCLTSYTFLGCEGVHLLRSLYERGCVGGVYYVALKYLRGAKLGRVMEDPRAVWRFDSAESGPAGAVGDLGSHLDSLVRFVVGEIDAVLARLVRKPNGIELDSTATVVFRTRGGLDGSMHIGQLACGHDNEVAIELWGERGSLMWSFAEPDVVQVAYSDGRRLSVRATDDGCELRLACPPIRPGEDAYVACFQRLYEGYIRTLEGLGSHANPSWYFPTFDDGAAGVRFIEACVASERGGNTWVALSDVV